VKTFNHSQIWALDADRADPLAEFRAEFEFPHRDDGSEPIYLCGNSLGLMPKSVPAAMQGELTAWGRLGVDGHFKEQAPWFAFHEQVRDGLASIVGAKAHEVVAMNSLTVNLHLMLVSLYKPTPSRYKILMEPTAFPSDTYAVQSQVRLHGFDIDGDASGVLVPQEGETLELLLERHGDEIALLLVGGVNYYSGELYDLKSLAISARRYQVPMIADLAHAVGNLPLQLHDWGVDAAVWCSYKYLNSGPGAVGGCFVHERHAKNLELDRFAGWWGNDPSVRFRMHLEDRFRPVPSADAWQLSNPSVFGTLPLICSLEIFERAGLERLRQKSIALTRYLEQWVDYAGKGRFKQLTPSDPTRRGAQLSLFVEDGAQECFTQLESLGLVADFRRPGVIRVAPAPLYNSFNDVWRLGQALLSLPPQES
jgi:kynureninase